MSTELPNDYISASTTVSPMIVPYVPPSITSTPMPSFLPSPSIPSSPPSMIPTHVPVNNPSSEPNISSSHYPTLTSDQDPCYKDRPYRLTSSQWWTNNHRSTNPYRDAWFLQRQPYQPILNSNTMIIGVLYSYTQRSIQMSVYFPPLYPIESRSAKLIVQSTSTHKTYTKYCQIKPNIWHCLFQLKKLPVQKVEYTYKVHYHPNNTQKLLYTYNGIIPIPIRYPRIATLGCLGVDATKDKHELVTALQSTHPDLLILNGDQTYHHYDLVHGFLETLVTIHELTRNRPTIVLMDDHDYGQGNLWGADTDSPLSGQGFKKPACYLNDIETLMMSHNPNPAKPLQLENGLQSRFTNYKYGRVDFAILEVRKFKQGGNHSHDHRKSQANDSLLGDQQETWLNEWCDINGSYIGTHPKGRLKIVLAATPFASLMTHRTSSEKHGSHITNVSIHELDANGYPEDARNRVMEILKGCSNLILSGDQHAGIAVTYDEYEVSECVTPAAINSIFWRFNKYPINQSYQDFFGHSYTLHNVWNVEDTIVDEYQWPKYTIYSDESVKAKRGDGFMVVELNGKVAKCQMWGYWLGKELMWEVTVKAENMKKI